MTITSEEWMNFISIKSKYEMTLQFLFPELKKEESEKLEIDEIYHRIHELKIGGLKNDI